MPGFIPFAGGRGAPNLPSPQPGSVSRLSSMSWRRPLASLLSILVVLAVASALSAQTQGPAPGEVVLRAYTFKYQRAGEALALVYPLLSPRGTVEFQPQANTLVIRDTQAAVRRVMPVLRDFDRPAKPLRLEVIVVRASRSPVSPPVRRSDLPEQLTQRLHNLLAFDVFERQAGAQLAGVENQWVVYEVGPEYRVSFRFGTLRGQERVKLSNFRIARRAEGRPEATLLQANLSLVPEKTTSVGLANNEASKEALMLVLTLREGETSTANRR